ncbi:MAG: hypothetical protein H7328_00365 [Bdellovibrio sp.]|nr:hypothetical protein [Bdellovibrio sp.]
MKLRHLLLFIVSCAVLILSELVAGSLIALALLFQLALLIKAIPLSKKSQFAALKIFLFCLPTFFFWGGIHSFVSIYSAEEHWLYFIMASVVTLGLCLIVSLQGIIIFDYLEESEFLIGPAFQKVFNDIQKSKGRLFKTTGLLFIFSFIPWLLTDWKLIFSVTATLLYLNWHQLKLVIVRHPS